MIANGCRKFEFVMARYVHGEILRHEREELERHLSGCPGCRALLDAVSGADRLIRSLPPEDASPPAGLHERIMAGLPDVDRVRGAARRWGWGLSLAATAASAALAVLSMQSGRAPEPVRTVAVATGDVPAPAPIARETIAPAAPAPVPEPRKAAPASAEPAPKPAAPVAVAAREPEVRIVREVRIYLYAPAAQRVAVTGDFNGWDARGVDLRPASGKEGVWEADLRLPPGAYAYNFIVDGDVLVPDPESPNQMPDGFGGTNSILLVKEGTAS